jgi:uncharacterized membrane protein YbhN (UPF0104 family)
MDAFWISWVRTFANQILPLSGLAAYAQVLRRRVQISWSELAALATPQFVLAAGALGCVGLVAVLANADSLRGAAAALAALALAVIVGSVAVAKAAATLVAILPPVLSRRVRDTSAALRKLSAHPHLIARLILLHAFVILARGVRLWVLFSAAGVSLDWRELLLVTVFAESTLLIQMTPGGLGIREGALVGGAVVVGVAAPVAAGIAVIDRLFMIGITILMALPGFVKLSGKKFEG